MTCPISAQPGPLPEYVNRRARAKTMPADLNIRGLTAADLVILLAFHDGDFRQRRFHRNQLFLQWWEESGSYEAVRSRWFALALRTRRWIAPGSPEKLSDKFIRESLAVARKTRLENWVLREDARPDATRGMVSLEAEERALGLLREGNLSKAEIQRRVGMSKSALRRIATWFAREAGGGGSTLRLRPRRSGLWCRNRLWLNWWETVESPTYGSPDAILRRFYALPQAARALLLAGPGVAPRTTEAKLGRSTVCCAVKAARRKRDGDSKGLSDSRVKRIRRAEWLRLNDARSTTGMTAAKIARSCAELPQRTGKRRASTIYVINELHKARWERELDGKPALHGLGVWALLRMRESRLTRRQVVAKWNRLSYGRRLEICPTRPEDLPEDRLGEQTVRRAMKLALENGAEAFVAQRKGKGWAWFARKSEEKTGDSAPVSIDRKGKGGGRPESLRELRRIIKEHFDRDSGATADEILAQYKSTNATAIQAGKLSRGGKSVVYRLRSEIRKQATGNV
ncbi:MAG TPA: hypothetical protein VMY42_23750 [Thermoguttaceae bacterium]|nr:hypothetical protein [Thermoguttaceae bacterium]